MTLDQLITGLRAPDQRGAGRVEHLDNGKDSLDRLLAVESNAVSIWSLDTQVIPGLLQTPAYSAAIIRAANRRLPPAEVRRLMHLKHSRVQQLKDRLDGGDPPQTVFVVGQAAIERVSRQIVDGGQQLRYLLDVARSPRCTVMVLPMGHVTPGLTEHYTMYGLWHPADGRKLLGYMETALGGWYSTCAADLERLNGAWEEVRLEALRPSASLRYIGEVIERWTCTRAVRS